MKESQKLSHPAETDESKPSAALAAIEVQLRSDLAADPKSAALLYRLALVLRQESKVRESLDMYTRAATIQKPNAGQLRSVALDYVLLNDYDDAIHWLRIALGQEPDNIDVLYSLGRCFYTQDQLANAEASFGRVLELSPRHLKAEENLGLTYDAENKPEKAEQALRKAAEWADAAPSNDYWPYLDLGAFLLDEDRAEDALPSLTKAANVGPECAACHEKLGRALVSAGKADAGVKELQIAVKLDPQNPTMHLELGRAYRTAGNQEASRAEFELSKSLYGEHHHD